MNEKYMLFINSERATFVGLTDAPEVETIQRLLNENKETSLLEEATAAIERRKNAVRVYKV